MLCQTRLSGAGLATLTVAFALGCGSGNMPTKPSPTPAPPAPAKNLAMLTVSTFVLEFQEVYDSRYYYRPRLSLSETGGKSGATIKSITFLMSDGDSDVVSGPGCFITGGSDRVPAGGTWNVDAVYYYCLDLASRTDFAAKAPTVIINFTDDAGTPSLLTGSGTVR